MKLVEKINRDSSTKHNKSKSPHKRVTNTDFNTSCYNDSKRNSKYNSEKISPRYKSNSKFSTVYP